MSQTHAAPLSPSSELRRVLFLLLPQVHLLDLGGPAQVFDVANELCGYEGRSAPYQLHFCASQSTLPSAQGLRLADLEPLPDPLAHDLILIPGMRLLRQHQTFSLPQPLLDPAARDWLRLAHSRGAHLASICTGAFALAEADLLAGKRCTTHFLLIDLLRQYALDPEHNSNQHSPPQNTHKHIHVLDDVLFTHDGTISTSAGFSSGVDLCLSLLEQQHGPLFVAKVARALVVYLRRDGSQSQHSIYLEYRTHLHPGVHRVQDQLMQQISQKHSLDALAQLANSSVRSLTRAFKTHTGLTPLQYQQRLRLELAQNLMHNPHLTLEAIATQCGFEDARHFRRLWQDVFGTSPSSARKEGKRGSAALEREILKNMNFVDVGSS
jgi:transcriptional regulator GlxA family with amidase domain